MIQKIDKMINDYYLKHHKDPEEILLSPAAFRELKKELKTMQRVRCEKKYKGIKFRGVNILEDNLFSMIVEE